MIFYLFKKYIQCYQGIPKSSYLRILLRAVNDLSAGITFFLTLYFTKKLHFSISQSGIIMSCYGVGTIISSIGSGKLSDQFSSKKISVIYLIIKSIGLFVLVKAHIMITLMSCVFILGFTDYGFYIANTAWLIKQHYQHQTQKLKIFGLLSTASNVGMSVAILLSAIFFESYFQNLIFSIGLLSFFGAIFLLFLPSPKIEFFEVLSDPAIIVIKKRLKPILWISILFSIAIIGVMFAQIRTIGIVYLHQAFQKTPLHTISIILLLNLLLVAIFQTPITSIFKMHNKINMMKWGALLVSLGMTMLSITTSLLFPIIACCIYTLGEILFFPNAQLVSCENKTFDRQGVALSWFYAIYASSLIVGPIIGSVLFSLNNRIVWLWCGFLGVTMFLIFNIFSKQDI